MQSKKYQCLNINVITLVVYATNNKFIYYGQKPAKNPMQKLPKNPWQQSAYANKNLLKIPCGQKSARITQKSFVKTLT